MRHDCLIEQADIAKGMGRAWQARCPVCGDKSPAYFAILNARSWGIRHAHEKAEEDNA